MRSVVAMGCLCMAWAAGPSVAGDAADTVLRQGRLYPVSGVPLDGSVAIRDGRIAWVGPDGAADAWIGPETRVVDLGGRAVTPGWVDAHSHLLNLGAALSQVDLVGTTSLDAVIARAAAASVRVPAGTWIRGRGWDQNDWEVASFPTNEALSVAIPDHPVWLTRIDGHAALLNEAALAALRVDASTPEPDGGRILRDAEGRPTGVLIDAAMAVAAGMPDPAAEEMTTYLEHAERHCLERGLTTVTEMGLGQGAIDVYEARREAGELGVRVAIFLDGANEGLLQSWFGVGPSLDPEARLFARGVKLYADGALGSRGAALIEPYDDDPGNLGLVQQPSRRLRQVCERALAAGFQVGIHAIGDRGNLLALDAIESAGAGAEHRFRIEHAQVMRLQDIERMARLGVIASMQPTHATSDMPWAEERVGADRIAGAYAWRKVLDAGGRLALGSDFPVERADPLLGFHAAVSRQDLEGRPSGGWLAGERLSRDEALRGFTLDAAHSLFLEDEIGSIEAGKRADLVVFDRDPMTVAVEEIPEVRIDMTWLDGELVFERRGEP